MVVTYTRKFGVLLFEKSMREVEIYCDLFSVAVVRSGVIVGHVQSLAVSLDALKQCNRHSRRRSSTTTNWCEVGQLSDQLNNMPITMATPPANRVYIMVWVARKCVKVLFRGFNFCGLPVNCENRENWIPQKFPAIQYRQGARFTRPLLHPIHPYFHHNVIATYLHTCML